MFCQDFMLTVQSSRSCRSYHLAGLPGDDGLSQARDLPVTAVSDGTICQTTARPPRVPWQGYRCWLRVLTFWEQRFDVLGNLGTVLPGFWEKWFHMVPEYCLNCSFLLGLCSQPGGVDQIDGCVGSGKLGDSCEVPKRCAMARHLSTVPHAFRWGNTSETANMDLQHVTAQ